MAMTTDRRGKTAGEADRLDPDVLLDAIRSDAEENGRGRLKIFFGMCAGVGKTYAMLQEARMLLAEGRDVVAGIVETHGRPETGALMEGLERLPVRTVPYRGTAFAEFDLDGALARKPAVVLVDELAHTNVPGSRHIKRYQDVEELLDHGITVYTTLNVQHLESRSATVEEITGVAVQETVPDSVLDRADDIELVDISPSELLKRFTDGKIYAPENARAALRHFFRKGNVTALREMALRATARQVNRHLVRYRSGRKIGETWKSGERLLVAVGPSPFSTQLVGWTRRMADTMNAEWLAVNVEMPGRPNERQTAQLTANLHLARELGAEVVVVRADDPVEGIMQTALTNSITQIVVGKTEENRLRARLKGGSLVERLIRYSGNIDIYVVRGDVIAETTAPPRRIPRLTPNRQYALAFGAISTAVAALFAAGPMLDYLSVAMFLLFAVTLLSLWLPMGPVLAAAAFSALAWNFFFIPPRYTFHIARFEDLLVFSLYFIIAIVTGTLTSRIRINKEAVRQREARAAALYAMSRALASAASTDAIVAITVREIGRIFDADVAVCLNAAGVPVPHPESAFAPDVREESVLRWVAENRKPAGRFTETLPLSESRWLPLATGRDVYGVAGVRFRRTTVFTLDQETLLENLAGQAASALERERFNEERRRAETADASERLFKTLLNTISHEFRTPLAVISGVTASLTDPGLPLGGAARDALLTEMSGAADRLNGLVENLLNMSRLESGNVRPAAEWCDVSDLFQSLKRRAGRESGGRAVSFETAPGLPIVRIDAGLAEIAVGNLLQNALRHTPPDAPVRVRAAVSGPDLVITVRDGGPGLPPDVLPRLFEKFYRAPGSASGGTGLGLSISRGLVEAMGGRLTASNASAGGALFIMRLPAERRSSGLEAGRE
jgi:two-component system, OmpR family, sensor histidine kinase KdpD